MPIVSLDEGFFHGLRSVKKLYKQYIVFMETGPSRVSYPLSSEKCVTKAMVIKRKNLQFLDLRKKNQVINTNYDFVIVIK